MRDVFYVQPDKIKPTNKRINETIISHKNIMFFETVKSKVIVSL